MAYNHHNKAGNRGDVVKHPALIAALDTVIFEGEHRHMHYADLFAGYASTVLQPAGEWMRGIGALHRDFARVRSPHLKCWLSRYLNRPRIVGTEYPGSSTIASDTAAAHNCRIEMTLWDISSAACDDLAAFHAGADHQVICREASISDPQLRSANFLFIDPPGLQSRLRPECPTWESILRICETNRAGNILVWLPIDAQRNIGHATQAAEQGLSSTTTCWAETGVFIGCQLFYRLPNGAVNALRVSVEEVAELAGWHRRDNRPVCHLNA